MLTPTCKAMVMGGQICPIIFIQLRIFINRNELIHIIKEQE